MFVAPKDIDVGKLRKRGRGYARQDVDDLLSTVIGSYEQIWAERDRLHSRVRELEASLAGYREYETLLRDSVLTGQKAAEELRLDAQRKHDEVVEEARREAERILESGREECAKLQSEIDRLRRVERDVQAGYRAFLVAALEVLEGAAKGGEEAPLGQLPETINAEGARTRERPRAG
jgi:cell division initiation protein